MEDYRGGSVEMDIQRVGETGGWGQGEMKVDDLLWRRQKKIV